MPTTHKGPSAIINNRTKIGSRQNENAPIRHINRSHIQKVYYFKKLRSRVRTTMGPEKIIPIANVITKQIRKTKAAKRYVNTSNTQRYFIFSKSGGH